MKKRTLIIFTGILAASFILVTLAAMLKILYPGQTYDTLMILGLIGSITAVAVIVNDALRKTTE